MCIIPTLTLNLPSSSSLSPLRVLQVALKALESHALLAGELEPASVGLLSRMFELFVTSWQRAEDTRRAKQQAEESLYKYRSTAHGQTLTEEQLEARQLRRAFPSFEKVRPYSSRHSLKAYS